MSINETIKIELNEVLRYLGASCESIGGDEKNRINEVVKLVKDNCSPMSIYKIVDVGELSLPGNDIKTHLNTAREAVIMAATCGIGTDRLISRLQVKDMSLAVIADAVASVAVESICDNAENEIRKQIEKEGRFLTGRFSPGYGDLPLGVSRQFLDILASEVNIGLSLTENGLLSPIKSVTAILGILDEKIPGVSDKCLKCSKRATCSFRKK